MSNSSLCIRGTIRNDHTTKWHILLKLILFPTILAPLLSLADILSFGFAICCFHLALFLSSFINNHIEFLHLLEGFQLLIGRFWGFFSKDHINTRGSIVWYHIIYYCHFNAHVCSLSTNISAWKRHICTWYNTKSNFQVNLNSNIVWVHLIHSKWIIFAVKDVECNCSDSFWWEWKMTQPL